MLLLLFSIAIRSLPAADAVVVDASGNTVVNGAMTVAGAAQFQSPMRLVPSAATGAPTTGTWNAGTLVTDAASDLWQCTATGTPGTWRKMIGAAAASDGAAKAWINFQGSTASVRSTYNLSVSRVSAGVYNVTFLTPMPDANYAVMLSASCDNMVTVFYENQAVRTASSFQMIVAGLNGSTWANMDKTIVSAVVFSH
jgi:hypothetical protein